MPDFPPTSRRAAFSLVEILVVIAILAILATLAFTGGPALINHGKAKETQALLSKLSLALDEYRREVNHQSVPNAKNRFNGYPPDDPHVLQAGGSTAAGCTVALRNTGVLLEDGSPVAPRYFDDARNNSTGQLNSPQGLRHGDVRAMVLSMRLFSPKASKILDTISPKYWVRAADEPILYQYRPDDNSEAIPLDYLVDAWGTPLEYFSTCICGGEPYSPRVQASNAFVHDNSDGAVLVSYGPNGNEQFAADTINLEGDSSMVGDWWRPDEDHVINHPFNDDNIYSSDFFAQRIRQ